MTTKESTLNRIREIKSIPDWRMTHVEEMRELLNVLQRLEFGDVRGGERYVEIVKGKPINQFRHPKSSDEP